MGRASGLNNQGIMHAVFEFGGQPICGSQRALMATVIDQFREYSHQCKRCAAKLRDMDERAAKKKSKPATRKCFDCDDGAQPCHMNCGPAVAAAE